MESATEVHEGTCACGGVRVRITAKPVDSCYCHCSICRRSTGAPLVAVVVIPAGGMEVELAEGVELVPRATSNYLTRHHCSRCGAAIYNRVQGRKRYVDNVLAGLFEHRFPMDRHIYYADRVLDVADDLPKHDGWEPAR